MIAGDQLGRMRIWARTVTVGMGMVYCMTCEVRWHLQDLAPIEGQGGVRKELSLNLQPGDARKPTIEKGRATGI